MLETSDWRINHTLRVLRCSIKLMILTAWNQWIQLTFSVIEYRSNHTFQQQHVLYCKHVDLRCGPLTTRIWVCSSDCSQRPTKHYIRLCTRPSRYKPQHTTFKTWLWNMWSLIIPLKFLQDRQLSPSKHHKGQAKEEVTRFILSRTPLKYQSGKMPASHHPMKGNMKKSKGASSSSPPKPMASTVESLSSAIKSTTWIIVWCTLQSTDTTHP